MATTIGDMKALGAALTEAAAALEENEHLRKHNVALNKELDKRVRVVTPDEYDRAKGNFIFPSYAGFSTEVPMNVCTPTKTYMIHAEDHPALLELLRYINNIIGKSLVLQWRLGDVMREHDLGSLVAQEIKSALEAWDDAVGLPHAIEEGGE